MRIGIDIGGTKIEVIALGDSGAVLSRLRVTTPNGDYQQILEAVANLVRHVESEISYKGTVGVGSPGAISLQTGLIKNSNSAVLNNRPLDSDLSKRLARPIRLENDANCFVLSEAIDGAGAGANVVFGAILGTGVGGGITVGKQLISGRNRISGEWGHNPLPWPKPGDLPGRICYCGKTGCIETYLSGSGLAHDYYKKTGRERNGKQILEASIKGDTLALECLDIYLDRLARSLASVINILDPDAIVLGGGISNVGRLYAELPSSIERYCFSDNIRTPILQAAHGDSSGVRGAAWLWPIQTSDQTV